MFCLEDRFRTAFSYYHDSGMSKVRRGHIFLVCSKLLELVLVRLGLSVKRKARLVWGEQMTVIYPEVVSLGIARYGFFSEGLTSFILKHLKPGMTFLDVGAHLGYFTLLGARLVGDTGQVHSFEPTPTTFEYLRLNAESKSNINLNQLAITSHPGIVTLYTYIPRFSGINSIHYLNFPKSMRSDESTVRIPSTSIDEYVGQHSLNPHFVKIDTDGAEYEILQGMEATLNRCKPVLSVEVGDRNFEGIPSSRDLVSFLLEKGYQAYEFLEGSIVKHELRDRYGHTDIFFLPEP